MSDKPSFEQQKAAIDYYRAYPRASDSPLRPMRDLGCTRMSYNSIPKRPDWMGTYDRQPDGSWKLVSDPWEIVEPFGNAMADLLKALHQRYGDDLGVDLQRYVSDWHMAARIYRKKERR